MSTLILQTRMVKHCHSWPPISGMKVLRERDDVHHNTVNKNGTTLFSIAALKGHEGVVKTLLYLVGVNSKKIL